MSGSRIQGKRAGGNDGFLRECESEGATRPEGGMPRGVASFANYVTRHQRALRYDDSGQSSMMG